MLETFTMDDYTKNKNNISKTRHHQHQHHREQYEHHCKFDTFDERANVASQSQSADGTTSTKKRMKSNRARSLTLARPSIVANDRTANEMCDRCSDIEPKHITNKSNTHKENTKDKGDEDEKNNYKVSILFLITDNNKNANNNNNNNINMDTHSSKKCHSAKPKKKKKKQRDRSSSSNIGSKNARTKSRDCSKLAQPSVNNLDASLDALASSICNAGRCYLANTNPPDVTNDVSQLRRKSLITSVDLHAKSSRSKSKRYSKKKNSSPSSKAVETTCPVDSNEVKFCVILKQL